MHEEVVAAGAARAYAEATNDPNPRYRDGTFAPPVFAVVPTWEPVMALGRELVPDEHLTMLVHAAQDMHFHRPLRPGQRLVTRVEPFNRRVNRFGTSLCLRATAGDPDGTPALDVYTTVFVKGWSDGGDEGPDQPPHRLDRSARDRPLGEAVVHVDDDQPRRYADASRDRNPIHLDPVVAEAAGLPGVVLHGLCTLAMCSRAVLEAATGGDPAPLRRLAVRFSEPVLPGDELTVSVYDGGRDGDQRLVPFEARVRGSLAAKDGLAVVEMRS
jgi:acyl dehydratase